jgi:hypothetical protein
MGDDPFFWFRPTKCASYVTTHRPGSEMTGEMGQKTSIWFGGDSGMGDDGFKSEHRPSHDRAAAALLCTVSPSLEALAHPPARSALTAHRYGRAPRSSPYGSRAHRVRRRV